MSLLRVWRRYHGRDLIAEVSPTAGMGTWEACAWQLGPRGTKHQARRHFSLLTGAQAAADEIVGVNFSHACDKHCGDWTAVELTRSDDGA
jgi:hypothetical protein